MLRVIVRVANCGSAANVGGPVDTKYKTFDVDLPDVEGFLKEQIGKTYNSAEIIGVEIIEPPAGGRQLWG